MTLAPADRAQLLPQLDRLARSIEELLLTGLTTASETTRQALGVTFQEAARLKLLRLGSTLRVATEELGRYTRNESTFSQRRLLFFLNRAWLLARGLSRAITSNDEAELQKLLWSPPVQPVEQLDVVTLGVVKKVALGAFCAFEFRLRSVSDSPLVPTGTPLTWSAVFPIKPGTEIPPEGYLHLPHEQKFTAHQFLEKNVIRLQRIQLARDESGPGRLTFTKATTVAAEAAFADWERFHAWDIQTSARRASSHEPNPFELEVELHEEVVLKDWSLGDPAEPRPDGRQIVPVFWRGVTLDATISTSIEGQATRAALEALRKKKSLPPLFGLVHYESCRLVLQPLAVLSENGPVYLTISNEAIDRKKLLQSLKFT